MCFRRLGVTQSALTRQPIQIALFVVENSERVLWRCHAGGKVILAPIATRPLRYRRSPLRSVRPPDLHSRSANNLPCGSAAMLDYLTELRSTRKPRRLPRWPGKRPDCSTRDCVKVQRFPTKGVLFKNLSLCRRDLARRHVGRYTGVICFQRQPFSSLDTAPRPYRRFYGRIIGYGSRIAAAEFQRINNRLLREKLTCPSPIPAND